LSADNKEIEVFFPDPEEIPEDQSFTQQEQEWEEKLGNYKYETIAYMAASGMRQKEICAQIGMTQSWVSNIVTSQAVQKRIREIQKEHFGGSIEERFKKAMPQAMKVMEETIEDGSVHDQRLKVDTSKWVLEKVTGKATQTVAHEGAALSDLMLKLDSLAGAEAREVEEVLEIEANRDPMDEWILNNVPTHAGVGKKDKGENSGKKE